MAIQQLNEKIVKQWREHGTARHLRAQIYPEEWQALCDLALKGLSTQPEEELREATMLLEAVQERMYRYSPYSTLKAKIDAFLEKRHQPQKERS